MSATNATTNAAAALAPAEAAVAGGRVESPRPARLALIEEPRGLKLRFAYWGMRHWVGKVLTPAKVLYARVPESMIVVGSLQKFQKKVQLELSLQLLIGDLTSQINGCTFCEDLGRSLALRQKLGLEGKFDALLNYRIDPAFTVRERAALAYVEEATRNKRVSDETFAALRAQFSEREIVEITLLNAIENLYNLTNLPLGIGSDGLCALAQHGPPRSRSG
jgi:alkylhydroperoxidase family enzyme